jgi:acyl transferase domain-containing protein
MAEPVDIWEAARIITQLRNQAPTLNALKDTETSFPLSLSQERLFALDALHPNEAWYNLPYAFYLNGALDLTLLKQSLMHIFKHQAVLRTHFKEQSGQVRQCIQPLQTLELEPVDLSELPLQQAKAQIINELRQPFQLHNQSPAFRCHLYQLEKHEYVLGFVFHHIISDYWSENQFFKELSETYNQYKTNKQQKPLTISYADFSSWQRQWLCQTGVLDFLLQYWQLKLQNLAQPDFPVEHSENNKKQIAFEKISLPVEQVNAYKNLANQHKVQLFSVLLSAFNQLLAEHLNTTDIAVFSPISNRNRAEFQSLMGDFSNPLILRVDLSGNPTQGDLLKQVGQVVSGAIAHQDLPLQLIKASIPLKLPQVSFSYLNSPPQTLNLKALDIKAWDLGLGSNDFDLFLVLMEKKGKLEGYLKYNTSLFSQQTINALVNKLNQRLDTMVSSPEQKINLSAQVPTPTKTKKSDLLLSIPELIKQIQQPLKKANPQNTLRQQLQQMPSIDRFVQLKQNIRSEIQLISGVMPTDEQGFFDLGLDSLTSIQLSHRLSLAFATFLTPTITLEYPSVALLAEHLNSMLFETEVQEMNSSSEQTHNETIAIVGMSCRFPGGAHTLEEFWELLHQGKDAVTDIPTSRWSIDDYYDPEMGKTGKMYIKQASFLQQPIEEFDTSFFGISPLEAQQLDPKQRLLLEVSWEALENAGIATDTLPTQTGIFVGLMESEASLKTGASDVYATTGTLTGIATGRLSYLLGIRGPNLCIDTASSSSLVALHLACQSLLAGECELALTGGVNVILSPELTLNLCSMGALAPDGHSKAFDASADGFGRGEGCGIVVLKRLSDALAANDHIWATIQGSTINHGGVSSSLTAPNKVGQTALIRQALQNANVNGNDISYVEAHGTGTKLGDPIEVHALADALGQRDKPLSIGSVKTNIGHLDACAGIAGLMKVALSLHHQEIPPHLHFKQGNPLMDWDNLPLQVPLVATPWETKDKPRIAGVSSFGMGGTNAHAILQEAPTKTPPENCTTQERSAHLLVLSGKTETALAHQITQYVDYLTLHPTIDIADVCYTANTGRAHYAYRTAVMAHNIAELREKLTIAQTNPQSQPITENPNIAFLFTGQGSQYWAMGRELFETHPLFREQLQACDRILRACAEMPLLELLYAEKTEKENLLFHTKYTQPALFSIEYALAKLWQSWGVMPHALIGHSVGEYVAACIAGVFNLEDGLKLIAERGRLMQALPVNGTMVAVQCTQAMIQPILNDYSQQLTIAGFNAPQSLVLSGETTAINAVIAALENKQVKCHRLKVSHAFHSALMEPMLSEFAEIAQRIEYAAPDPQFTLISNVTGKAITHIDADYWVDHIRQPVRFAQGMDTLSTLGIDVFIEIGAKPTLIGLGQQCITTQPNITWLPSLYPNQYSDWEQLLESVGKFHVLGGRVDWQAMDTPYVRYKIPLPTYPFQRQRYWVDKPSIAFSSPAKTGHPLLGERLPSIANSDTIVFQNQLSALHLPYLNEHQVYGQVILPATVYIEMILNAAKLIDSNETYCLQNIMLSEPLRLSTNDASQVQLQLTPSDIGYQWKIFSLKPHSDNDWLLHIEGELKTTTLVTASNDKNDTLHHAQQRCHQKIALSEYNAAISNDLYYGDDFQAIQQIFKGEKEALGLIELPTHLNADEYNLHPILFDCCLRITQAIPFENNDAPYLPYRFDKIELFHKTPLRRVWSFAKWQTPTDEARHIDVMLFDSNGVLVAKIMGFDVRQTNRQAITGSALPQDSPNNETLTTEKMDQTQTTLRQKITQADPTEQLDIIKDHIKTTVKLMINVTPDDDRGFFDLGMDSLSSIQLASRLGADLAISLPRMITLEYGTVTTLATYLLELVVGVQEDTTIPEKTQNHHVERENTEQLTETELDSSIEAELAHLTSLL